MRLLGIEGIWFPGLLCGTWSVALLMVLTARRVGRIGLLAIRVLVGVTRYAPEFMFGIYAEAPVILATTADAAHVPARPGPPDLAARDRGRRARPDHHAVASGAAAAGRDGRSVGSCWAWVGQSHGSRNPWLPFAVAVPPLTVVSYGWCRSGRLTMR